MSAASNPGLIVHKCSALHQSPSGDDIPAIAKPSITKHCICRMHRHSDLHGFSQQLGRAFFSGFQLQSAKLPACADYKATKTTVPTPLPLFDVGLCMLCAVILLVRLMHARKNKAKHGYRTLVCCIRSTRAKQYQYHSE